MMAVHNHIIHAHNRKKNTFSPESPAFTQPLSLQERLNGMLVTSPEFQKEIRKIPLEKKDSSGIGKKELVNALYERCLDDLFQESTVNCTDLHHNAFYSMIETAIKINKYTPMNILFLSVQAKLLDIHISVLNTRDYWKTMGFELRANAEPLLVCNTASQIDSSMLKKALSAESTRKSQPTLAWTQKNPVLLARQKAENAGENLALILTKDSEEAILRESKYDDEKKQRVIQEQRTLIEREIERNINWWRGDGIVFYSLPRKRFQEMIVSYLEAENPSGTCSMFSDWRRRAPDQIMNNTIVRHYELYDISQTNADPEILAQHSRKPLSHNQSVDINYTLQKMLHAATAGGTQNPKPDWIVSGDEMFAGIDMLRHIAWCYINEFAMRNERKSNHPTEYEKRLSVEFISQAIGARIGVLRNMTMLQQIQKEIVFTAKNSFDKRKNLEIIVSVARKMTNDITRQYEKACSEHRAMTPQHSIKNGGAKKKTVKERNKNIQNNTEHHPEAQKNNFYDESDILFR